MPGFDVLLGQIFGQAAQHLPIEDPHLRQTLRVVGKMQEWLSGSWRYAQQTRVPCAVQLRHASNGHLLRCVEPMIGACTGCHRPVCLDHASVVMGTGDLFCIGCLELVRQRRAAGEQAPPPRAQRSDEVTSDVQQHERIRAKHLRALKLTGDPTINEIKQAFRREAAKAHPDRAPARDKTKAHKRFIALGEARDWLLAELERKAA